MIINITGKLQADQLWFNVPNIFFDRKNKYKIGIRRVHFIIDESRNTIENNQLLMLCSNLVDRSAANPHQAVVYFNYQIKHGSIQSFKPSIVTYEDLQLYEMNNSTFCINTFSGQEQALKIREIFLQLEILRSDVYGRF